MTGHFLVGPTASGKSDIAQHLAEAESSSILSADSMLVYKDMSIGTAKPTPEQQGRVPYFGIDLVLPTEPFSTGSYLKYVHAALSDVGQTGHELIVVGGTGLYIQALLQGLPGSAAPSEEIRIKVRKIFAEGGVAGLRGALHESDSGRLEALDDPQNPRRLQRALELSLADLPQPSNRNPAKYPPIPGLRYSRDTLVERISRRVLGMFEGGLLEEVRTLRARYGDLSATAAEGIGYDEAAAVLDGKLSRQEAIDKITVRTRQLAKRQMTWFNRQVAVNWIDVAPEDTQVSIAEKVRDAWRKTGPLCLKGLSNVS